MAPEMCRGQSYDQQADMWSSGVILYIILCGYPPFDEDAKTFNYDFKGTEWEEVSDEAKDLISKLLVEDPHKRFSAEDAMNHKWLADQQKHHRQSIAKVLPKLKSFHDQRIQRSSIAIPKHIQQALSNGNSLPLRIRTNSLGLIPQRELEWAKKQFKELEKEEPVNNEP